MAEDMCDHDVGRFVEDHEAADDVLRYVTLALALPWLLLAFGTFVVGFQYDQQGGCCRESEAARPGRRRSSVSFMNENPVVQGHNIQPLSLDLKDDGTPKGPVDAMVGGCCTAWRFLCGSLVLLMVLRFGFLLYIFVAGDAGADACDGPLEEFFLVLHNIFWPLVVMLMVLAQSFAANPARNTLYFEAMSRAEDGRAGSTSPGRRQYLRDQMERRDNPLQRLGFWILAVNLLVIILAIASQAASDNPVSAYEGAFTTGAALASAAALLITAVRDFGLFDAADRDPIMMALCRAQRMANVTCAGLVFCLGFYATVLAASEDYTSVLGALNSFRHTNNFGTVFICLCLVEVFAALLVLVFVRRARKAYLLKADRAQDVFGTTPALSAAQSSLGRHNAVIRFTNKGRDGRQASSKSLTSMLSVRSMEGAVTDDEVEEKAPPAESVSSPARNGSSTSIYGRALDEHNLALVDVRPPSVRKNTPPLHPVEIAPEPEPRASEESVELGYDVFPTAKGQPAPPPAPETSRSRPASPAPPSRKPMAGNPMAGNPMAGRQNPMAGRQNPMAGRQNPMAGNPMAGRQSPMASAQRNPMTRTPEPPPRNTSSPTSVMRGSNGSASTTASGTERQLKFFQDLRVKEEEERQRREEAEASMDLNARARLEEQRRADEHHAAQKSRHLKRLAAGQANAVASRIMHARGRSRGSSGAFHDDPSASALDSAGHVPPPTPPGEGPQGQWGAADSSFDSEPVAMSANPMARIRAMGGVSVIGMPGDGNEHMEGVMRQASAATVQRMDEVQDRQRNLGLGSAMAQRLSQPDYDA